MLNLSKLSHRAIMAFTMLCMLGITASYTVPANKALAADDKTIIIQSTTSTANSGLLDHILPIFEKKTGIKVNVVAVGTGQAIKNARNGDGDVLLVHAKSAEEKFVNEGYGVKRYDVMFNDFIILGPKTDPAKISGMKDVTAALKKISTAKSVFTSRGDDSGTHKKELKLWQAAGLARSDDKNKGESWYRETGSGMGSTLNVASGMGAYVMSDRATWLAFKNKGNLEILVEGDKRLFNQYGVILVNPEKHKNVKKAAGETFIQWITGPEGQAAIQGFKLDGKQLFFPNAAQEEMKKAS
ncbi:MAG: tungsten ABC transporter substrate-binding protein [Rhodomicrobium sp.]|nr:MAG: tungsten ABC transporter substrate-binding protein [Rhodomicrobium sp.]